MTQEHKMYPGLEEHGWKLSKASGNYGVYGWGLGIYYDAERTRPHIREPKFWIYFGPWKWLFVKRIRLVD